MFSETSLSGNYHNRRVFVTGADGFIGSHLVETLVDQGAKVTALAQYNSFGTLGWIEDLSEDILSKVRVERGDIRDPGQMRSLIDGHEIVFHLAALISVPFSFDAPQSYVDANVTGTLNVLQAAREACVLCTVCTSTSEVYGTAQVTPITEQHPLHAQSPYAASKIAADMIAQSFALTYDQPVFILRPFNTFGPRQSERAVIPTIIRQALDPACDAIHIGDPTPRRDFNFVTDIAHAFLHAGNHAGSTGAGDVGLSVGVPYNAGSGTAVSIGDVVGYVQDITGANKPVVWDKERVRPANSEVFELLAGAEYFRTESGWEPQVTFREGLSKTVDWWREQIRSGRTRRSSSYLT